MSDNILLVDDDPDSIQLLGRILGDVGNLRFATSGEDALRLARESTPDLMLLDAEMPGISGFQVLEAFKAEPELADVPVIFVTSHSEPEFEVSGFERGAADFIAKPVSPPLVLARVKTQLRVKRLADELRRISKTDPLTGVANRRRFDALLEQEWQRAQRAGDPLALLMIDVDHFKLYNDHYGHPAGDACLRAVAQALLGASLRPADLVARYGGEEFVILLPQTPRAGAEHVARGVLDAVEALGIPHAASLTALHITVSVGVACYDESSACWLPQSADSHVAQDRRVRCEPEDLLEAADKALYCAKHAGRAQARLLDIADAGKPERACDITPSSHKPLAEGVEIRAPQAASSAAPGERALLGVRVLVVDDHSLDVMKLILELEGAQVWLASNGQEAIDLIRSEPDGFDVVLMDVQMPVLDGHAATRRIRHELRLKDLPIIGLTGDAQSSARDQGVAAGMDDYIVKPYVIETLVSRILHHVQPACRLRPRPINTETQAQQRATLPWQEIEGIDSNDVRARLRDDFGLFRAMLQRLLDEFHDVAIPGAAQDRAGLALHAQRMHRLVGSAGMLGATVIHQLAGQAQAASAAGDGLAAVHLATRLGAELHRLQQCAAPVLLAASADNEAHQATLAGANGPGAQDLADLLLSLRQQSLAAVERFRNISPQLQRILGKGQYERVCQHMDKLQFVEAADVLEARQR